MALELIVNDKSVADVNNLAFDEFISWGQSLDGDEFGELVGMCYEPWSCDIPELADNLRKALAQQPPAHPQAKITAETLLKEITDPKNLDDEEAVCYFTDGTNLAKEFREAERATKPADPNPQKRRRRKLAAKQIKPLKKPKKGPEPRKRKAGKKSKKRPPG